MKRRADTRISFTVKESAVSDSSRPASTTPDILSPDRLRLVTADELDALLDRLESPAPERLRGLFAVQLLAVRGSDRFAALWRPLRNQLNKRMSVVFRGKFFAVTSGHNEFIGRTRALSFHIRQHPTQADHLIIDYNTANTPRIVHPLAAEIRQLTDDTLLCRTIWRHRSYETRLLYFTLHLSSQRTPAHPGMPGRGAGNCNAPA